MRRELADTQFDIAPVMAELGYEVPAVLGTRYQKCRCVFHEDKTASASVNQYGYKCHSCDRSGDALKFLQEEGGLSFVEALQRAQECTGHQGTKVRRKRRASDQLL